MEPLHLSDFDIYHWVIFVDGLEVLFVLVQEIGEKVVDEDLTLNRVRQLVHEPCVGLTAEGRETVVLPVVIKEVLDLGDKLLVQGVTIVEPRQESNPLAQVFVMAYLPERLVVHENLNELTHDE